MVVRCSLCGGMSRTSNGAPAGVLLAPRRLRPPTLRPGFCRHCCTRTRTCISQQSQSQNQCRQLGVGLERNVVPLCTARTRPQDLFCLCPCAGGKRHAPGAQSSAGSSASDAKKAKVMPSYVFTSAMKPTDEFAAPLWARPHRFRRFTTRSRCFLVQGRPCALSERGEGAARGWASGGLLPLLGAADLTRRGVALLPNRGRQCLEAPAMSVLPSANAQASYSAMVVAARADSRSLFARAGRAFAS